MNDAIISETLDGVISTWAQDEERSRIARELHDDIGQRLAILTMGLDALAGTL